MSIPKPKIGATNPCVLIVDDDELLCELLSKIVADLGGRVTNCHTAKRAIEFLATESFDLVILDNRLPDGLGSSVFGEMAVTGKPPTTILLTGFPDLGEAVKMTQHGLFQYLQKPFDVSEFTAVVKQAFHHLEFQQPTPQLPDLCGESAVMGELRRKVTQAAMHLAAYVLIGGETGVGKELVAQLIHSQTNFHSTINPGFVAIDCSALPGELIEAELFGSEKGAYTGAHKSRVGLLEEANDGTIFFDEIGDMPLALQTRLLRFLETREYRRVGSSKTSHFKGRVIAASHRNLVQAVQEGTFRQDLYYRLEVLSIRVPSLRERREDIPALANNLLGGLCEKYKRNKPFIRSGDLIELTQYAFPGNVRELRNIIERSVLQTPTNSGWLEMHQVIPQLKISQGLTTQQNPMAPPSPSSGLPLSILEEAEYSLLKQALISDGPVISRVARKLGLTRQSVLRRLEKWPDLRQLTGIAKNQKNATKTQG